MLPPKIRVLIIDDSAIARNTLSRILETDPEIQVVGTAPDALIGLRKISECLPDVLTLDVEMPKMDGLTFLERLMSSKPMPVVMVSAYTAEGSETAMKALELGALEIIEKPRIDVSSGLQDLALQITDKVKAAAQAKLKTPQQRFHQQVIPGRRIRSNASQLPRIANTPNVIAFGASTGGTDSLREILAELSPETPGILIVQHMPKAFTTSFAKNLDRVSKIRVKEAVSGDRLEPGLALLSPGDQHLELKRETYGYFVELNSGALFNRHRPSVDVLFDSVAQNAGIDSMGILLTGMGSDGAKGLLQMRQKGAWTIAQEESSCVVYGMPRVAVELGATREILTPEQIITRLQLLSSKNG
ncbi:MAG: chemotaxis response regulator protein-glutamate methylesterase [Proteobacteria bacterium]|nr:chemotaxis response regulator protein-glutamate methylesterase [Pseudomonadota bacterium]